MEVAPRAEANATVAIDPVPGPLATCGAGTWLDRRVLLGVSHMQANGSAPGGGHKDTHRI